MPLASGHSHGEVEVARSNREPLTSHGGQINLCIYNLATSFSLCVRIYSYNTVAEVFSVARISVSAPGKTRKPAEKCSIQTVNRAVPRMKTPKQLSSKPQGRPLPHQQASCAQGTYYKARDPKVGRMSHPKAVGIKLENRVA